MEVELTKELIKLSLKSFVRVIKTRVNISCYESLLNIKLYSEWKLGIKVRAEKIYMEMMLNLNSLTKLKKKINTKILRAKFLKWRNFIRMSKEMKERISDLENVKSKDFDEKLKETNKKLDKVKKNVEDVKTKLSTVKEQESDIKNKIKNLKKEEEVVNKKIEDQEVIYFL